MAGGAAAARDGVEPKLDPSDEPKAGAAFVSPKAGAAVEAAAG